MPMKKRIHWGCNVSKKMDLYLHKAKASAFQIGYLPKDTMYAFVQWCLKLGFCEILETLKEGRTSAQKTKGMALNPSPAEVDMARILRDVEAARAKVPDPEPEEQAQAPLVVASPVPAPAPAPSPNPMAQVSPLQAQIDAAIDAKLRALVAVAQARGGVSQ